MNAGSWLVLLIVAAIVAAVVVYLVRQRRKGGHVGCDGCGSCGRHEGHADVGHEGACCHAASHMATRLEQDLRQRERH